LQETDSMSIGQLNSFAVFQDGRLSIGDGPDCKVKITSSKGIFINNISKKGRGLGETLYLRWHCIDNYGRVWISDYNLKRVSVYDTSGSIQNTWSPLNDCENCDLYPGTIRVVKDKIYIAITRGLPKNLGSITSLVTVFDFNHKPLAEYGKYEKIVEEYSLWGCYYAFAIDSLGNLFFIHDNSNSIQKYSSDGQLLKLFNFPVKEFRPTTEARPKPTILAPEKSKKAISKWYWSTTVTGSMEIVGKYLFASFTNTDPKYADNPELIYRHDYLQIFDLDGNCLVDYLQTPGEFLCTDASGILYFRESDKPRKTIISKYRFTVISE
jgi:hypothetical protein